jgi:hypothetical protein
MLARRFGKGLYLSMLLEPSYAQMAEMAQRLADPARRAALLDLVAAAPPDSVPGAFQDFARDNAFTAEFAKYQDGSNGIPVWLPLTGRWKITGGAYHELDSNGYDFLAIANARIRGDYVVNVRMQVVEGILEGGVVFNLPTRFSRASSQMVRFCGHEALWVGPFNSGAAFSLEQDIRTGLTVRDKEWHTLTVTVLNSQGKYDLAVDGKSVATGLKLTNVPKDAGAYIGLVSCRGHVAFSEVTVAAPK